MLENISIYCKNTSRFYEVPIGSSLLDIYKIVGEPLNGFECPGEQSDRRSDILLLATQRY